MSTQPLWLDGAPPPRAPAEGSLHCEVAVVGAGLAGTAATLALSHAGVDVVQLEAGTTACGASGRNAGFLLQGTAERYDRAVGILGRDRARRIHGWSLQNHALLRQRIDELDLDCAYLRRGSLQLAGSPEEEAALRRSAALLAEDGFAAELVGADALPESLRSAGYRMGLVLPEDGELHPAQLVQGARDAAERAGARCFDHSPVATLEASSPGEARLRTPQATVHSALVLVCTNARISSLLPWFRGIVDPVRGQMLATAPAPPLFPLPVYADHGFDYWRQLADGRVVLGGWRNLDPEGEVGLDDRLHPAIQARMGAFLQRFPPLASTAITHRWSGTMGFARDGLPVIGPAPGTPAALAAAGFTGHGFGFAWLAGEALAALATDGNHPVVADLGPSRLR